MSCPPRWRRLSAAMVGLLLLMTAGCSGSGASAPAADGGGPKVPLTYLPAGGAGGRLGEPRLQATVRIGSRPVNLLVDTGSTGLKVLASAVGSGDATPTGATGSSSYLSGLQIGGREARATLRLGDVTADNQSILLVDSLACTAQVPNCEAAHGRTPEEFGGVFDGILGIGVAERDQGVRGCCTNPMLGFTSNGAFTVHFDEHHPELALDPDRKTLNRYRTVSLRQSAPMQACLTVSSVLSTQCAPVVFDTGTPTLALEAPRLEGPAADRLIGGGIVDTFGEQVTFDVAAAGWTWTYRMPREKDPQQALNALSTPLLGYGRQPSSVILAGLPAFTRVDVLYDLRGGRIGLAPR
ncbi:DUF3443 family protein [Streptomyces sp. ET3-23]|uniref:DUF3443 family protein n=1 Tax=Streptomyces sp. ET3-23 TaxID=2885643 RepID=UPI001D124BB6|nr:DUF3443 family protein [Streptomyces sp. ET3-23]MCC2277708.1 DUF3443 family protein [Streptomyces sp. ET3-23]